MGNPSEKQMDVNALKGIVFSDFNPSNFCGCLNRSEGISAVLGSEGEIGSQLLAVQKRSEIYDFAVVWTRPEGAIPAFAQALEFEQPNTEAVFAEIHHYTALLKGLQDRVKHIFVPTWTLTGAQQRGWGMLDLRPNLGLRNLLLRMNLALTEALGDASNFYVLDAQSWMGQRSEGDAKLWYLAKVPFSPAVFVEAAHDIEAALNGIGGKARKLVLLDLDNTLWGGEVGEVGWEHLRLGGHDATGEAFADFQRALKALTRRGIVLGLLSKNDEQVALEAIEKHPEMILSQNDFAGWRINWKDKAENAVELVEDLNLGLSSAVFIDDQPAERSRVQEALPEVFVPEWPSDPLLYAQALQSLRCFDVPSVSNEDRQRAGLYVSERKRRKERQIAVSFDDWLKRLNTRVIVIPLNSSDLPRAAQLLNRINQMNLRTRRLSEDDLANWLQDPSRFGWLFRVSDAFGDAGVCGFAGLQVCGQVGVLTDFALSCRVMGRQIETAMLHAITRSANTEGVSEVQAEYVATARNQPCHTFFIDSHFKQQEN
ncbi:MAG: HAD-IIIC family phosphatase, partial [Candidatus Latescibacteria bacterium]|nr:HAD-IIIC family phosphatase [Candidatus Latescibacterota bacterium]